MTLIQPRRFNSQPRKGADSIAAALDAKAERFNSQPRKGADEVTKGSVLLRGVSTHSPARGLTQIGPAVAIASKFQLTAPQGG